MAQKVVFYILICYTEINGRLAAERTCYQLGRPDEFLLNLFNLLNLRLTL